MIQPEFSRPVTVSRLSHHEKVFDIEADAPEREALARRFGILAVASLTASVRLALVAGGAVVRLKGRLSADVVQACVVTLEPVPAHVEEDFELTYAAAAPEDGAEVVVDLDVEDPPEPIDNGMIDMGEAVAEHLALALDPFPRAPGAVFTSGAEEQPAETPAPNPFAALVALKKK